MKNDTIKSILTVTLNPALDRTLSIEKLSGQDSFWTKEEIDSAGGKGLNVSRALSRLGVPSKATGLIGGHAGKRLSVLLDKLKIEHEFVPITEETRTNYTLINVHSERKMHIIHKGPHVKSDELKKFHEHFEKLLKPYHLVVISGRNAYGAPHTAYADLIRTARKHQALCLIDASSEALREALKLKPFLITPNLLEAEELLNQRLRNHEDLKKGVRKMHGLGARHVIISLGKRGAIGSNGQGMWKVKPPVLDAINEVGCGDSLLAGFVFALRGKCSFVDCLRMAVACGSANTQTLKPGFLLKKDVRQIFDNIKISNMTEKGS